MSQTADQRPVTIRIFPPDEESKKALQGVEGTRVTPGVVSALDGSTCAGPEMAGALTLLHTTFVEDTGAQRGYRNFAAIKADFRHMPGFLRWLTFNDGPHAYALGLWRDVADVAAFVNGDAHRAMVREQLTAPSSTASSPACGPHTRWAAEPCTATVAGSRRRRLLQRAVAAANRSTIPFPAHPPPGTTT